MIIYHLYCIKKFVPSKQKLDITDARYLALFFTLFAFISLIPRYTQFYQNMRWQSLTKLAQRENQSTSQKSDNKLWDANRYYVFLDNTKK